MENINPNTSAPNRPLMIQGPMPIEAEHMAAHLENVRVERTGNFAFYIGTLEGYPVIVAKTSKGMENAAAATALGIARYAPAVVINQGTAGGHDPQLQVGDIVLGRRVVNIGNMKAADRAAGEGSDPLNWKPMDVMASEGSAGEDKNAERIRYYDSDPAWLELARQVKDRYTRGKVVEGTVGSANLWNNEIDRIRWFHEHYGTSVEEMEGASVAQICAAYDTPFLSVRVLSNNKTNGGTYDPTTAETCQAFVLEIVRAYLNKLRREAAR